MEKAPAVLNRNVPEFLSGGGEMGERIRNHDWSKSSLGPIDTWPLSLRTCIRIMLTSRQPIWIGWGKDLIKFYNDPYKAIVRGKHPWALGQPASVVWKEIWPNIEHMLRQVMEEDQGTYVESQLLIMERNGYPEETYYTFSYTPIPGDNGTTEGMICANSDDTDRIITERQLRTLTQLASSLVEARSNEDVIREAITTLQNNPKDFPFGLFYSVSGTSAQLSATTDDSELSQLVPHYIDLSGQDPFISLINEALASRKMQVWENLSMVMGEMPKGAWGIPPAKAIILPVVQAASREVYGFLITGVNPYRLLDEKYSGFISLLTDQLATSFSDVHILDVERKKAAALAEIDKAKTTFFSNISHEFRTPLTLLLGPIQDALANPNTHHENIPRLEVAYRNALRMQKLVNTLLDFSRIEAGRMEGRFTAVDIASFTEDLVSTFRSAIEKAGMQLIVRSAKITDEVFVDIDMWEKIILNLVSNAFKYSKGGKIEIQVGQEAAEVVVTVIDSGIGIPSDQLEKIFDRFHRVENTEGRSLEGTGIGLAMVKELVKVHSGHIDVRSELGKGSAFVVKIPTGRKHLPADKIVENLTAKISGASSFVEEAMKWIGEEPGEKIEESVPLSLSLFTGESQIDFEIRNKIVLADDNADMRDYVRRLLSPHFEVIVAIDGIDAYEKMILHKPELLLSDIMMPKLDGLGLLKKVRSHPELRNIPVIFLSARAGEEAKVEGLDAGADDYLVKPFSAKELIVRVTNQVRINQVRRETEQQFYQLFLQAPAIINVMRGSEHKFEFFHPKNKEIFGDVDYTNLHVREAFPELHGQGIFEMLDEVYEQGKTVTQVDHPILFKKSNGELVQRYLNFTYQPWYDLKGRIQGVLNFAIDVTETVEGRIKVEESEKQFKTVLIQSPSIFLILKGPAMIITFANEPLLKSWSKTADIIGKSLYEALPELEGQNFPKLLEQVFATGEPYHGNEEKAVVIKNGIPTELYYNYVYQPILEQDKTISGVTVMATDITDQVVYRKEIEESENRFRTLAETLPQLIWMVDNHGQGIYASSRWKEYTGLETDEAMWGKTVHPDDLKVSETAWHTSLTTGKNYKLEIRLKNKFGEYRWFYGQSVPMRDESGIILKWIGSFTDIHDQKEIESRLEQVVEERTKELQRSNTDLQQFAHVASHDLKEPVRKIKTFTDRLQHEYGELLPEKGQTYVEKIHAATNRMYTMIEGVLNYSILNVQEEPIEMLDLNHIISQIESDLELMIQQKNARIEKKQLPKIEGASVLIYQLFYNLINNSLKFSKPGTDPVIHVSGYTDLDQNKEVAKIVFSDNGIGFKPDYSERIFDTFTRLNSKDKFEGTGLGLALCKKIVERHEGKITASGQTNVGASFTISIPVKQSHKEI